MKRYFVRNYQTFQEYTPKRLWLDWLISFVFLAVAVLLFIFFVLPHFKPLDTTAPITPVIAPIPERDIVK